MGKKAKPGVGNGIWDPAAWQGVGGWRPDLGAPNARRGQGGMPPHSLLPRPLPIPSQQPCVPGPLGKGREGKGRQGGSPGYPQTSEVGLGAQMDAAARATARKKQMNQEEPPTCALAKPKGRKAAVIDRQPGRESMGLSATKIWGRVGKEGKCHGCGQPGIVFSRDKWWCEGVLTSEERWVELQQRGRPECEPTGVFYFWNQNSDDMTMWAHPDSLEEGRTQEGAECLRLHQSMSRQPRARSQGHALLSTGPEPYQ